MWPEKASFLFKLNTCLKRYTPVHRRFRHVVDVNEPYILMLPT